MCYVASARLAGQDLGRFGLLRRADHAAPRRASGSAAAAALRQQRITGIPLENVHAIAERWGHIAVHIYDGADHGFNCDARSSFHPDAAALAKQRTLDCTSLST